MLRSVRSHSSARLLATPVAVGPGLIAAGLKPPGRVQEIAAPVLAKVSLPEPAVVFFEVAAVEIAAVLDRVHTLCAVTDSVLTCARRVRGGLRGESGQGTGKQRCEKNVVLHRVNLLSDGVRVLQAHYDNGTVNGR